MHIQYDEVGKRIRRIRLKQNMSQAELAEKLGIAATHMSNIENGKTKLGLEIAVNLSEIFNVSIEFLIGTSNPDVVVKYGKELEKLMSDSTPAEEELYINIIKSTKKAIRSHEKGGV